MVENLKKVKNNKYFSKDYSYLINKTWITPKFVKDLRFVRKKEYSKWRKN